MESVKTVGKMLRVENLKVEAQKRVILEDINLNIRKGEVVALFGPNGSGKTTLIRTIMGFSGYKIKEGRIIFKGKLINNLPIEERVSLGIGLMHQHPPKVRGIRLYQVADFLCKDKERTTEVAQRLSLKDHLSRELNLDFSGGEMKRSELFQVILQDPDLLLLDEPESGVDIENISIMGKVLNDYLKEQGKSTLIITHTGYILDYIKAQRALVLIEGKVWCEGEPSEVFRSIKKFGYQKCKECYEREVHFRRA